MRTKMDGLPYNAPRQRQSRPAVSRPGKGLQISGGVSQRTWAQVYEERLKKSGFSATPDRPRRRLALTDERFVSARLCEPVPPAAVAGRC